MSILRKLGRLMPRKQLDLSKVPCSGIVMDSGIQNELKTRAKSSVIAAETEVVPHVDFSTYSKGYQTYTIDKYRGVGPDHEADSDRQIQYLPAALNLGVQLVEHPASSLPPTEDEATEPVTTANDHLPTLGRVPSSFNSACSTTESRESNQTASEWGKAVSVPPNWGTSDQEVPPNWGGGSIEVLPNWGESSIEVLPNWGHESLEIKASWADKT